MPRPTSADMLEAKRKKAEERVREEERLADEEARLAAEHAARDLRLAKAQQSYRQLASVAQALYTEVDKLGKKHPTLPVTHRMLERANKVIRDVKELIREEGDVFTTDVTELVPAGDMPEIRDVVLTLAETIAATNRFADKYRREWDRIARENSDEDEEADPLYIGLERVNRAFNRLHRTRGS
ncbi:MAG: hypothetical protein M3441_12760 [Chloroflexota bacterium]|nr:hypothetical protein [Chloroflexota bacterium]